MNTIGDLYASNVDTKPINYDWSSNEVNEYSGVEGWRFWEYARCEECGQLTDQNEEGHAEGCDESVVDSIQGPMMNYFYPIDSYDFNPEEAAKKLADTCLCVVEVDGDYGLALTGGGMDLSWEICEAYVTLGYLPPVHFADLPGMAGKRASEENLRIIAACRRSVEIQVARMERALEKLNDLETKLV